ncbi:MAG: hypothetical protein K9J12_11125 [Melioribacteraceae bacterium]|nr:hypothetical protein [Melioribacteraceae bacterium]MCF8264781.1 hypothetical protein [Melioribacteraceae bacterium]MCF8413708.1 hypothetical protein [Melioribacteraceae bacterium]
MEDDNYIELRTISAKISDSGSIEYDLSVFQKLKKDGFEKIEMRIYGDALTAVKSEGLNIEAFNSISKTQNLPPSVVYYFLKAKGELRKGLLSERIAQYDWK